MYVNASEKMFIKKWTADNSEVPESHRLLTTEVPEIIWVTRAGCQNLAAGGRIPKDDTLFLQHTDRKL